MKWEWRQESNLRAALSPESLLRRFERPALPLCDTTRAECNAGEVAA